MLQVADAIGARIGAARVRPRPPADLPHLMH